MKTVIWAGACSLESQPFKDIFETHFSKHKNYSVPKTLGRSEPFLIVSEDIDILFTYSHQYPRTQQIYVCRRTDFLNAFQIGVRPLTRHFFILDCQTQDHFKLLLTRFDIQLGTSKKLSHSFSPIPSMQNSLEVLRRITEDRLFELRNFSHQEEDRRKNFRSLIHLARCLSMSRDIEEVVQYLWNDLRSIDGILGLSLLVTDASGQCHQIVTKSGKFHFEEIPPLTDPQVDFIGSMINGNSEANLVSLTPQEVESLNFMLKKGLKHPYLCVLTSETSAKIFFLFLETDGIWKITTAFQEFLQERIAFIHLTLEKHLLQEEIKSKASLWATTFDDLQDPLGIITQKRNLVRANRQFQSFKGTICYNVWAKTDSPCSQCPSTVTESTVFEIQVNQKIYQARIFPIKEDEFTIPQAFIAHYVDITTERILYSRLIQSEKMMAVGRLAGDLSQALSFPLKKIIQITEKILAYPTLTGQAQNDMSEIRKASLRSLRIIDDFENFSKGKIDKELVMAETVVEKTIPLIKALIHGHRFHLQLAERKHPIRASLSLLQQVLYNLLRNAHQSMKSHGELRISTEPSDIGNIEGVQISVLDSGSGIDKDFREKIFQPFVTSKGSTDGIGLGLNIVKQIVESHSGKVGYEPRPEGGSKFWIWLPLSKENLK